MTTKVLPEFILFGDSLTTWSFEDETRGFGWYLRQHYRGSVNVVDEEIVVFGASMVEWSFMEETEGLGWRLTNAYAGKAHVLNEGQAGYTSKSLKSDFDRIIERATAPGAAATLLFTIFVGANDACIIAGSEYVPWPQFEANIRAFVETILTQDAMSDTKIVLIGPPPINGPPAPRRGEASEEEIRDTNDLLKSDRRYRTYQSKKRYAEGMLRIAKDYEETGRVVGLNFWQDIVDALYKEEGGVYDDELPPGCGLLGSRAFPKGWFTDGLHLDVKGYAVLSHALFTSVTEKWPELAPERI